MREVGDNSMAYTIEVAENDCIGCGACVSACGKGFKMVDGKSHPIQKSVAKLSCEQEAADICPVSCIKISGK
jgi:ferredoxin